MKLSKTIIVPCLLLLTFSLFGCTEGENSMNDLPTTDIQEETTAPVTSQDDPIILTNSATPIACETQSDCTRNTGDSYPGDDCYVFPGEEDAQCWIGPPCASCPSGVCTWKIATLDILKDHDRYSDVFENDYPYVVSCGTPN